MKYSIIYGIAISVMAILFSCSQADRQAEEDLTFDPSLITDAQNLIGLKFDTAEQRQMQRHLTMALKSYESMRAYHLENSVYPALLFTPSYNPPGETRDEEQQWF
ncbi:MAG: hypothetical protein R2744_13930, partial [Bacteroidales bacterium]